MYGGVVFVRWALVERQVQARLESEEWWRQQARKGKPRRARRAPQPEPIPVEELRDRLRVLGWG
jgi:hypothetical protein